MNTLVLLAAACVSGQVVEPQPMQALPANMPVMMAQQPGTSGSFLSYPDQAVPIDNGDPEHRSLLQRLRDRMGELFHHRHADSCTCCCNDPSTLHPVVVQGKVQQVVAKVEMPPAGNTRFQDKSGHAKDYSWVIGQLQNIHADGGLWVIRYGGGDADRFGGSVAVAPMVDMKNFHDGDLVMVRGEIVNAQAAAGFAGGPLFRAVAVDLIEGR